MVAHPVTTIFAAWLFQLGCLGLLQAMGLAYGFAVWPMGEDRNAIYMLLTDPGTTLAHHFWQIDGRNPLVPWWYLLFRAPILGFDPTLYLLRMVVALLLATGLVMLLRRLWRGRADSMAVLTGLFVLFWNFNFYHEQIIWPFQLSQAIALWTVYAYVVYLDGRRKRPLLLGIVLLGTLVSIATYTLQAGTILMVGVVALFRGGTSGERQHLVPALQDIALLAGMATLFLMIWYTAMPADRASFMLDPGLIGSNALSSLRRLVWHPDFTVAIGAALRSPRTMLVSVLPSIVLAVVASLLLRQKVVESPGRAAAWGIALFICMALPILALESTSANWYPGTRSRMIYQVATPVLFVAILLAAAMFFGERSRRSVLAAVAAIGVAIAVPTSFEYNHELVARSAVQRSFARQLGVLADEWPEIGHFIVRWNGNPNFIWRTDELSDTYARTFVRNRIVTLRFLQRDGAPSGEWWQTRWKPQLRADGVRYPGLRVGGTVDYDEVMFLDYDGSRLSVAPIVDPHWLGNLQVLWQRDTPILQSEHPVTACPFDFNFARIPPGGKGWSVPERMPDGSPAMWMSATMATILLPPTCVGPVTVELTLAGAMAPDIVTGLELEIAGRRISLARSDAVSPTVLRGNATLAASKGFTTLRLRVPRTIVPEGGDRTLAVMLSRLSLRPATEGAVSTPPSGAGRGTRGAP